MKAIYDEDARKAIVNGSTGLYRAAKGTYGPLSGNVGVAYKLSTPIITHDGVTVARHYEIDLPEKVGADIPRNAAIDMDRRVRDGTTTAIILSHWIVKYMADEASAGGNVFLMKRQLDKDAQRAVEFIEKNKQKITSAKQLIDTASISAKDEELGKVIGETVYEVGSSVTVEKSDIQKIDSKIHDGYTFDKGYLSPYLIGDTDKERTVLKEPAILLINKTVKEGDLLPALQKLKGKREILIIAEAITGEALSEIVNHRTQGVLDVVAVESPGYGSSRLEYMKDLASITGATIVGGATSYASCKLGSVESVTVGRYETRLVGFNEESAKERKKELKSRIKETTNAQDKETLESRVKSLSGKGAIIYVGGETDSEREARKFDVDDAVGASIASLDGTVAGGGAILLDASREIGEDTILGKALQQPFKILLENVGIDYEAYINESGKGMGVDVTKEGGLVDLIESGIIEPAETTKEAIKVAVSTAGIGMTMKTIIYEEKKDD